jgi:hypothetical protein
MKVSEAVEDVINRGVVRGAEDGRWRKMLRHGRVDRSGRRCIVGKSE